MLNKKSLGFFLLGLVSIAAGALLLGEGDSTPVRIALDPADVNEDCSDLSARALSPIVVDESYEDRIPAIA